MKPVNETKVRACGVVPRRQVPQRETAGWGWRKGCTWCSAALVLLLLYPVRVQAYKEVPYVHCWIALQAWNILPPGEAKTEMEQFLYGGAPYEWLFGDGRVW